MKRLCALAWDFVWISTVTLGGGLAMVPFMERAFVERRKWLSDGEMAEVIAIVQSLPGLIAVNMAVMIGYKVKGVLGAVVAAVSVCIVPFIVIALVAGCASGLLSSPTLDHAFLGVRAGTAALILLAFVKLAKSALTGTVSWVLGLSGLVAAVVFGVPMTMIVICGFAAGILFVVIGAVRRARR